MEVTRFPPLPPLPTAPEAGDDERQSQFQYIAGTVTETLAGAAGRAVAKTRTGFRASAVDLGWLQATAEHALERFDTELVRARWSDDVGAWLRRFLISSIQRCKQIEFELADDGIAIKIETQDDRGYYNYTFDIFPGRKPN